MKRLILPLLAATADGVVTQAASVAGPTAGLGETAAVAGLTIRPLRVVEDSRCQINARCVWADRVVLRT